VAINAEDRFAKLSPDRQQRIKERAAELMDAEKRRALELAGWHFGDAETFLGCTDDEIIEIENRFAEERRLKALAANKKAAMERQAAVPPQSSK
jgi:hypothetical protein